MKRSSSVFLSCIQRSSCLPDENNVAALQEEVKQVKLRELETLRSFREMQDAVTELNQRWQVRQPPASRPSAACGAPAAQQHAVLWPLQHHMSRGSSTGGGGGHWKESPKKNAMNELQDKLMTVRLREAEAQAELREVKLNALQLESQVRTSSSLLLHSQEELLSAGSHILFIPFLRRDIHLRIVL